MLPVDIERYDDVLIRVAFVSYANVLKRLAEPAFSSGKMSAKYECQNIDVKTA